MSLTPLILVSGNSQSGMLMGRACRRRKWIGGENRNLWKKKGR
jgi:hypothetical protein